MRIDNRKGFVLTEILIAMAIFVFIAGGIFTTFYAGNVSYQSHDASVSAQSQVRLTLETMGRDLRVAQGISLTQDSNSVALSFTKSGEGNVSYAWANSGSNANQIVRTTDSATRIIARDVTALSLVNSASNVEIDVTASIQNSLGETVDYSLTNKLAKR